MTSIILLSILSKSRKDQVIIMKKSVAFLSLIFILLSGTIVNAEEVITSDDISWSAETEAYIPEDSDRDYLHFDVYTDIPNINRIEIYNIEDGNRNDNYYVCSTDLSFDLVLYDSLQSKEYFYIIQVWDDYGNLLLQDHGTFTMNCEKYNTIKAEDERLEALRLEEEQKQKEQEEARLKAEEEARRAYEEWLASLNEKEEDIDEAEDLEDEDEIVDDEVVPEETDTDNTEEIIQYHPQEVSFEESTEETDTNNTEEIQYHPQEVSFEETTKEEDEGYTTLTLDQILSSNEEDIDEAEDLEDDDEEEEEIEVLEPVVKVKKIKNKNKKKYIITSSDKLEIKYWNGKKWKKTSKKSFKLNRKYKVKVRAYRVVDGKKYYSGWVIK